jgi:hypothetical protein
VIRDFFTEVCETVCQGSVIVPFWVEGVRADVRVLIFVIGNEVRWLQPERASHDRLQVTDSVLELCSAESQGDMQSLAIRLAN